MPETLIKVDLSKSAYDNDMIHNRWHPDIPIVAWVKPGVATSPDRRGAVGRERDWPIQARGLDWSRSVRLRARFQGARHFRGRVRQPIRPGWIRPQS